MMRLMMLNLEDKEILRKNAEDNEILIAGEYLEEVLSWRPGLHKALCPAQWCRGNHTF